MNMDIFPKIRKFNPANQDYHHPKVMFFIINKISWHDAHSFSQQQKQSFFLMLIYRIFFAMQLKFTINIIHLSHKIQNHNIGKLLKGLQSDKLSGNGQIFRVWAYLNSYMKIKLPSFQQDLQISPTSLT